MKTLFADGGIVNASVEEQIAELEKGIKSKLVPEKYKEEMRKAIEKLKSGSTPSTPSPSEGKNDRLQRLLDVIENRGGSSSPVSAVVDEESVAKIVEKELRDATIGKGNLSSELLQMIKSNLKIQLTNISFPDGSTGSGASQKVTKLMYLLISDFYARQNAYLWGKAGTGKTHTAKEVAKFLKLEVYTINCNQYTSELEIKGGQTIDGYEEGKLIEAWQGGSKGKGALLILDELPKLDPNTAGILNDALAMVKKSGSDSMLENGKGDKFEKSDRFFCIATGNIIFTREDENYSANFQQDASLQDRFVGSIYQVFDDVNEQRDFMNDSLFIFNYIRKVGDVIVENAWDNFGFVSFRILESLKWAWHYEVKQRKAGIEDGWIIKTLIDGVDSFIKIFDEDDRKVIVKQTNYEGFKEEYKAKLKLENPLVDSEKDKNTAENVVKEYNAKAEKRDTLIN